MKNICHRLSIYLALLILVCLFESCGIQQSVLSNNTFSKRKYLPYTLKKPLSSPNFEGLMQKNQKRKPRELAVLEKVDHSEIQTNLVDQVVIRSEGRNLDIVELVRPRKKLESDNSHVIREPSVNLSNTAIEPNPISPPSNPPEWVAPIALVFGLLSVPLVFYSLPLAIAACVAAIVLGIIGLKARKLGILASIGMILGFVAFFLLTIVGIFYLSVWLAY